MHRSEVESLPPGQEVWVASVRAPMRDWSGAPGCRKAARFLVERRSKRASRETFATFDTRSECLQWVMRHRMTLNETLPAAQVTPALLDRWLLGID